jgi:hypothetical protein
VTHEMIKDRGQEEARFMVINCNSLIHHQQWLSNMAKIHSHSQKTKSIHRLIFLKLSINLQPCTKAFWCFLIIKLDLQNLPINNFRLYYLKF